MKRRILAVILASASLALAGHTVSALVTNSALTAEQIQTIRQNCISAKSQLGRVRASDALLRVNIGRQYEAISQKLMIPFNSRMVLNRLDSTKMVSVTSEYDKAVADFLEAYRYYEEEISRAAKIDCATQPEEFHGAVVNARDRRVIVADTTQKVDKLIDQYGTEFEAFAKYFLERGK